MAKDDDDNAKEGVDYELVDKDGYQTRRFFTRAEKKAKAEGSTAPTTSPKPKPRPADLGSKSSATKTASKPAAPKTTDSKPPPPKKRPADLGIPDAPTSSPRPPKRPVDSKVAGRGGYAAGAAAGMPGSAKTTTRGDRPGEPGAMPKFKPSAGVRPEINVGSMPGSAKTTTRGDRPGTPGGMPGSAKTTTRGDRPGTPGGTPGSAKTTTRGDRPGVPASLPAYKKPRFGVRPDSPAGMPAEEGTVKKALRKVGDSLSDVVNYIGENVLSSPAKKAGGVVKMKEGSAKDMREDKAMAKKRGMTMKDWEKSAADKKHDAPKKMAAGGAVKKMATGKRPGSQNVDAYALRRANERARVKKELESDTENPGFFSGVIPRAMRRNELDKVDKKSQAMVDQYGANAAKSRGFMSYDTVPSTGTKTAGTPTKSNLVSDAAFKKAGLASRAKTAANNAAEARGVVKKSNGGTMRGTGAAIRGKRFTGSC